MTSLRFFAAFFRLCGVVVATLIFNTAIAQDAAWPAKPVRLIVPFSPGGAVDPLAWLLSARLPALIPHLP